MLFAKAENLFCNKGLKMKIVCLVKVVCLIVCLSVTACASEKFSVKIFLTKGERSKDSHSEKTAITISGNQLTISKTYTGRNSENRKPLNKTFTLADEEINAIVDLIQQKQFHEKGEKIERPVGSPSSFFDWVLITNFDGKEITNRVVTLRSDEEIKTQSLYKNANELMRQIFAIIKKYEASIPYVGLG